MALPFPHVPHFTREEFLAAPSNLDARTWLRRTDHWPQRRLVLWGERGCGKSHLLHVWAAEREAEILSGHTLDTQHPLPDHCAVAVDDADACRNPADLLYLLNRAGEADCAILLAARLPPARWPATLPDLSSRLRAITAVRIASPEDSLLRALLARLLVERQLAVPQPVQDWLLLRLPRTPAIIRAAAQRLDSLTLERGGAVSRPLAMQILAELRNEPQFEEDFASVGIDCSSSDQGLL
jgi:chromosomal replication initiation ATPase DnaA